MTAARAAPALGLLAAALLACGDDGPTPAADARDGTGALDAGPGPITVTVLGLDGTAPLADTPVYFVGPDGGETAVITGADGRAAAVIAPETVVFVKRLGQSRFPDHVAIYTGIGPGMDFTLGAPPAATGAGPVDSLEVTLPFVTGAAFFAVAVSCSEPQTSGGRFFFVEVRPCAALEHATIVTAAFDAMGVMIAYGVALDVDLRALFGSSFELPATLLPVTATATFASVPPEVTGIQVTQVRRDRDLVLSIPSNTLAPSGSVLSVPLAVAPVGDRAVAAAVLSGDGNVGSVVHVQRYEGPPRATNVDLGATMLPFMTFPSISFGVRTAAWTFVGGGGRRPDVVVIRGQYSVGGPADIGFMLLGPGDRAHITWPRFPAALAAIEPGVDAGWNVFEHVGADAVGRDFADLLPTADAELRGLFDPLAVYRADADVWLTGH